jgi:hypothetical protein
MSVIARADDASDMRSMTVAIVQAVAVADEIHAASHDQVRMLSVDAGVEDANLHALPAISERPRAWRFDLRHTVVHHLLAAEQLPWRVIVDIRHTGRSGECVALARGNGRRDYGKIFVLMRHAAAEAFNERDLLRTWRRCEAHEDADVASEVRSCAGGSAKHSCRYVVGACRGEKRDSESQRDVRLAFAPMPERAHQLDVRLHVQFYLQMTALFELFRWMTKLRPGASAKIGPAEQIFTLGDQRRCIHG